MKKIWMMVWMGMCVIMLEAQSPVHVVKSGETLYSIARSYSVTINDLVKSNPGLSTSSQVKIGQRLTIPGTATTTTHTAARVPARLHTVTKGETVYSVAKKFGVTVTEIRQWNNLSDLNLRIGQKLVVSKADKQAIYKPINVASTPDTPYREEDPRPRNENLKANAIIEQQQVVEKPKDMPVAEAKPVVAEPIALRTSSSNPAEYSGIFSQYSVNGYRIKKNRGAANYLSDNTSGNQFLAFYNDAETGSIIRVTNMMNRKTIYVKVMGKVPPVDAGKEIMLKLGNKAAQELGVVDDKFLVEVASYQVQQ
jgi:LysM repeat protein